MNILFLISNYPHSNNQISGIFFKRIIEELVSRGHNITVISPINYYNILNSSFPEKLTLRINNNLIIYRPTYFSLPLGYLDNTRIENIYKSVKNCIQSNKIEFDIIDSRYIYPWSIIAQKLSFDFQVKYTCVAIGDDINQDLFYTATRKKKIIEALNKSSLIITVSENLRQILKKLKINTPIEVVYDGIDFKNEFKGVYLDDFEKKSKFTIGFVGSLTKQKGCDRILRIINETGNEFNWIIVGDGPYYKKFRIFSNVLLTGNLNFDEVKEYYKKMDMFLFPSEREGIPNVLKEASFFELPIITTNVGGIPEFINGDKNILFHDIDDTDDSFINSINLIIDNYLTYKIYSKDFKTNVIERFSITKTVDKLLFLYSKYLF